jgi:hypothetical protein
MQNFTERSALTTNRIQISQLSLETDSCRPFDSRKVQGTDNRHPTNLARTLEQTTELDSRNVSGPLTDHRPCCQDHTLYIAGREGRQASSPPRRSLHLHVDAGEHDGILEGNPGRRHTSWIWMLWY